MILLDTNVISEPMKPSPDPVVSAWLDAQALETLYLSAISVAELRFGVRSLPSGRLQDRLEQDLENAILPMFAGRVLAFDLAASLVYAQLISVARKSGSQLSATDGYIAAIASANSMSVATRDKALFEAAGLTGVNPWLFQITDKAVAG